MNRFRIGALCAAILGAGCHSPEITAVPLGPFNSCEKEGIPYYLPKPLLVISKNVRYIEESKVGLTKTVTIPTGFDDQAKYADVNSRTSFSRVESKDPTSVTFNSTGGDFTYATDVNTASDPVLHSASGAPITPNLDHTETFYTYQIVFVPDLSQKYGLRVKGGAGEIRATMNLVNGWMFTGLGPYYMKDSSTAQNILACGIGANLAASGVSDVVSSIADLGEAAAAGNPEQLAVAGGVVNAVLKNLQATEKTYTPTATYCERAAEIHVYESNLSCEGTTDWKLIASHCFDEQRQSTLQSVKSGPSINAMAIVPSLLNLQMQATGLGAAPACAPTPACTTVAPVSPDAPDAPCAPGVTTALPAPRSNAELARTLAEDVMAPPIHVPAAGGFSLFPKCETPQTVTRQVFGVLPPVE